MELARAPIQWKFVRLPKNEQLFKTDDIIGVDGLDNDATTDYSRALTADGRYVIQQLDIFVCGYAVLAMISSDLGFHDAAELMAERVQ